MLKRYSRNFVILSILTDGFIIFTAALLGTGAISLPGLDFWGLDAQPIPVYVAAMLAGFWVTILLISPAYDTRRNFRFVDELQNVTLSSGLAVVSIAGIFYLIPRVLPPLEFLLFVMLSMLGLYTWRALARLLFRLVHVKQAERRVLLVGSGVDKSLFAKMVEFYGWSGLKLIGCVSDEEPPDQLEIPLLGRLADLKSIIASYQIDDVVLALPTQSYGKINDLVVTLHDLPVMVSIAPDYFSLSLYRARAVEYGGLPMINLRDPAMNEAERFIKKMIDLVVGGAALIFSLPIMGLVALAIRIDSAGPILFKQARVAENADVFTMFKFRTMYADATQSQFNLKEAATNMGVGHKRQEDPRVTRVGRILRRTSLDELPQLFNVMKGEMSLVGPRPELPWIAAQYEPWQRARLEVPQGITGWWQVHGRANKPMHLHTEEDIYYVQNYSIWLDLFILVKTAWVVLRGVGAY